jgi:hypothetical protein
VPRASYLGQCWAHLLSPSRTALDAATVGLAAMGRGVSLLHAGLTGVLESCPPHSLLPPPGCSRSRCTSWERGRHELGQTREGLEGGWEEGGEKGGRDEGWREEEEVRRGWREGCGEGFDWWMGGGRGGTIEFQRILKREIVETRGNWIGGRSRLFRSSRNMVESGDASSRRLCAPGRARWHLWACTRALGAVVGKRCAREAGDCRDGRRRRHSSSRSQALTLGLIRCGTLDSRESASGAGRIDTSEAARCALCGEAFSA